MPVTTHHTEAELLDALRESDYAAFTEIYDRYWGALYVHAWKMLQDEEPAKDLVQDVFINIWTKASTLNINGNLSAYLFRAVRNKVLNLIRSNHVRSDYAELFSKYIQEHRNMILEEIHEKELLATIEEVVRSMPERMRRVFELSRNEHLNHREIAEQLNISEKTVKRQISNALQVLRTQIDKPETLILAALLLNHDF